MGNRVVADPDGDSPGVVVDVRTNRFVIVEHDDGERAGCDPPGLVASRNGVGKGCSLCRYGGAALG